MAKQGIHMAEAESRVAFLNNLKGKRARVDGIGTPEHGTIHVMNDFIANLFN
jgi:hypothetical protein